MNAYPVINNPRDIYCYRLGPIDYIKTNQRPRDKQYLFIITQLGTPTMMNR